MKLLIKTILFTVICAVCSTTFSGQSPEGSSIKKMKEKRAGEMKKLDFLVGKWEGSGWVMTQNGRQEFTVRETLQKKLEGQIIVVDGLGKSIDKDTGKERIVHQAFGVFSYDEESKGIKFRWYKAETGAEDETMIEISDKTVVWGFELPKNKIRLKFTEAINKKGNWSEIGEMSRDGGNSWFKFFEMELSRISD